MKKKQKQALKQKTIAELKKEVEKREKDLVEFYFKLHQGQVQNVHQGKEIKKEISFIKTIISQKEKK